MVFKIHINKKTHDTEVKILEEIASQLYFPDYFGKNLDALWDMMTDLSWIKEVDVTIDITGLSSCISKYDLDWTISFLSIMAEACRYWDGVSGSIDPINIETKHRLKINLISENGNTTSLGGNIWSSFGDGWVGPDIWKNRQ